MKLRVEVSKGQRAVLEPKGFAGALTGQGQALYGDSATVELKDDGLWTTGAVVEVIAQMGKSAGDALTTIADKPEPEVRNG